MSALRLQPQFMAIESRPDGAPQVDLGGLWLQFQQELRSFVRPKVDSSETCEDLLQTAFVRAQQSMKEGTHPREPRAWLYQIVRNLLVDTYRTQERQRNALAAFQSEEVEKSGSDSLLAELDAAEIIARALPGFLSALSEPHRQALELTDIEGQSQAEAAKTAGVSLSCMKARVRRARLELLEAMERCCSFQVDGRGRPIACTPRAGDSSCACN